MDMSLSLLCKMSNKYGANPDFVLAGGGNTSWKDEETLYIKGSGTRLSTITENGFVRLRREKLDAIFSKTYPDNEDQREAEVLNDILYARTEGETKRPSVETLLHEVYPAAYVLHLHPAAVNGLTCGKENDAPFQKLFAGDSLWIGPVMPGFVLSKIVSDAFADFKARKGKDPSYVFLENHGVFTGADSIEEIDRLMETLTSRIDSALGRRPDFSACEFDAERAAELAPAVRAFAVDGTGSAVFTANKEVLNFVRSEQAFEEAHTTFSPDHLVYCGEKTLFIEDAGGENIEAVYTEIENKINEYKAKNGCPPKIIGVKNLGFFACGRNKQEADTVAAVFLNAVQVAVYAESFGGGKPMPLALIRSIAGWECERYRKSVSFGKDKAKRLGGKIAIVTGSAQGFGKGVAEEMAAEGAYIGVADLNDAGAYENAAALSQTYGEGAAVGIKVNVTDENDVRQMVVKTVLCYGGIDILVNNAGIVRAGSLDEMELKNFELVTKINYSAYFLCVKHVSYFMKLQHRFSPNLSMDIIQINSKSGLSGSNKNFAYAGSKFGGIGLTQSFALELVPYRIKVNSVCPGNFLDGPLWCDPEKGLFLQYLKAGKVPGAKTIADVKKFYESKVPMNRGCTVPDVARAIFYCVEQQYETGQAVPVTGGQVMLN